MIAGEVGKCEFKGISVHPESEFIKSSRGTSVPLLGDRISFRSNPFRFTSE